jgi:hypothetical protein
MITNINDLSDTEHNRRYGSEIVRKTLSNPRNQDKMILEHILSSPEIYPVAVTVTFKNLVPLETDQGMKKATEYEYSKRVLNKVRKRLGRSRSKWNSVLPIHFFQYEYEQGSFFKPVPRNCSPHHIHGVLAIPRVLAPRIFDFQQGCLDQRLSKDLRSMDKVSTFLIEPLRTSEAHAWYNYMMKGKAHLE